MARNPKYQHEPIYPPHNWNDDERRFAYTLDKLFDELYQKIGALTERVKALEQPEEETEDD